ncbi:MAG TPA: hypothetical protein VJQ43_03100, partial [Thermoplasmata archaeon]|nr:hypothetical protein [Thermoplasmata archaeon]
MGSIRRTAVGEIESMQRNGHRARYLAALSTVAMMALVVPAIAVALPIANAPASSGNAPLSPAVTPTSQQWAYGGSTWQNVSLTHNNASYVSHAFFGWQVVVTATNTSLGTVELEAQRTMAASLFASYCAPSCSHPSTAGNLSIRGNESDTGFANLTALATVYENGTPTLAAGIDNASSRGSANLNESYSLTIGGHTASGHLAVAGAARAQVAFTPALGLVPWNAAPNVTWNASSNYTASGSWSVSYSYGATSFLGTNVSGSGHPSANVSSSGTVSVNGTDLGPITLRNGKTVPVIVLAISGPFDTIEGIILVPHGFAVFGSGHHDWDNHELGSEAIATSRLDVALDATGHHLAFVASAASYSGADGSLSGPAALRTAASGSAAPSATLVQGQPETVADAQHAATCLTTRCAGPSAGAASVLPLLVVGLIGVAVVAAIGALAYRSRNRGPAGGS